VGPLCPPHPSDSWCRSLGSAPMVCVPVSGGPKPSGVSPTGGVAGPPSSRIEVADGHVVLGEARPPRAGVDQSEPLQRWVFKKTALPLLDLIRSYCIHRSHRARVPIGQSEENRSGVSVEEVGIPPSPCVPLASIVPDPQARPNAPRIARGKTAGSSEKSLVLEVVTCSGRRGRGKWMGQPAVVAFSRTSGP